MDERDLIPVAVERRLMLNRLGFRLRDGRWVRGDALPLDEEQVDRWPAERWAAFVARHRHARSPASNADDPAPGRTEASRVDHGRARPRRHHPYRGRGDTR